MLARPQFQYLELKNEGLKVPVVHQCWIRMLLLPSISCSPFFGMQIQAAAEVRLMAKLHVHADSPNRITAEEVKCKKNKVCLCKWVGCESKRHIRLAENSAYVCVCVWWNPLCCFCFSLFCLLLFIMNRCSPIVWHAERYLDLFMDALWSWNDEMFSAFSQQATM